MSDTSEYPNMKTVDEQALVGAKIEQVDFGLPATHRCIRCDAQAYVEVEVYDKTDAKKRAFEMCAHHYTEHEPALALQAVRIIDHRPFLQVQERAFKGQPVSQ